VRPAVRGIAVAWSLAALAVTSWAHGQESPAAEQIPSRPGVDAPELAAPGASPVGFRRLTLSQPDQLDVLTVDANTGVGLRRARTLEVWIWYPAQAASGPPMRYAGELTSEPPAPPAKFTTPGIAVADAPPASGGRRPLVIVSHGYGNVPAAMTWLPENLASKGYIVAVIAHGDPPYGDRTKVAEVIMRRPLDIAFVAHSLLSGAHSADPLLSRIDPEQLALVGYSMGGYGVITCAGVALDPQAYAVHSVPGRALAPYAEGGPLSPALRVPGVKAVVAIAPYGGTENTRAWSARALGQLRLPLLLIDGDQDQTVGFEGVRWIFDQAQHAERALLVYENAGHSIGLNPAPAGMRERLWDLDWFEDPVWRARRINAINLHFITAFLDLNVRGMRARVSYLDVTPPTKAVEGAWPKDLTKYAAFSPGGPGLVWKGFQKRHVAGLELYRESPAD